MEPKRLFKGGGGRKSKKLGPLMGGKGGSRKKAISVATKKKKTVKKVRGNTTFTLKGEKGSGKIHSSKETCRSNLYSPRTGISFLGSPSQMKRKARWEGGKEGGVIGDQLGGGG